jgi:protein TonB
MRAAVPVIFRLFGFCLFGMSMLAGNARAADAEGCVDLKSVPRLEGCVIQECSAKQHDSFDALLDGVLISLDGSAAPPEASVNALTYTCPASMDLARVKRELDARVRKAGYQNVPAGTENKTDSTNPAVIARKGSQWLRWTASSEDGTVSYIVMSTGPSIEACGQATALPTLKQCQVVECASKSEDSVAMRTAQKGETSLTGNVQTLTLACPSLSAAQAFSKVEGEFASSGFEILFHDREHPESGWITARSGKRWVGLVSAQDGESVSYALTVVPSAEVLNAAIPEPAPVASATAVSEPSPVPAPNPAPAVTVTLASEAKPEPAPSAIAAETQATESVATSTASFTPTPPSRTEFVLPKPILQVPIEATHDRIYSVMGDVLISMLVDIGEDGTVTKAVLTGRITKDVLKLQGAALEAVSHWRFEPARQDGRIVSAVKIPVEMHFHGRPWRF